MSDFLLRSILTPIMVAVVATLVIEYLAKPRLEARKERLLRGRVAVDEFTLAMQELGHRSGALATDELLRQRPELVQHAQRSITELDAATEHATRAMARFPLPFALSHDSHIGNTSVFLGFLRGQCHVAAPSPVGQMDSLKEAYSGLSRFDEYFQVHLGFVDSQSPLVARLCWRLRRQRSYTQEAAALLENLNLRTVKSSDD